MCFTDIDPRFGSNGGGFAYDHMQTEIDLVDDYPHGYDQMGRGYPDAC